jgi:hypothetical protein
MNGDGRTAALLSLYDAMSEAASNEEGASFAASQPYLGELAGMSARNGRRLEPILEELGVVKIERPRPRGHNIYALTSFGHNVLTKGQVGRTLGQSRFHPVGRL